MNQRQAPLADRAALAYNAAVERQAARNTAPTPISGQINAAEGGRPEAGLGFEQYDDPWSPAKLIHQNQGSVETVKTQSTIPKN